MTKIKLLQYFLNDDGTYSFVAEILDDNHRYRIEIPRVEIECNFPKDAVCFTFPLPVGFTILETLEGKMLTFALPDKE